MTDARWLERLGELFETFSALPAGERASALDGLHPDDAALRGELRLLLASHEVAPTFLEGVPARLRDRTLATLLRAPSADAVHDRLCGRYEILERVGGGGMGVVYKARDLRLDRFVALKLLPPHLAADERARVRLLTEAKAVSRLHHPNIVVVHEVEESETGQLFISMAFHEGETLRQRLERGPLPVREAVDVARQMACALAATHRAGIVHRDIKPSNVLLVSGSEVKLLDFGIAKAAGAELTREGVLVGTVAYMSPEQTRSEVSDPRMDVWSLGAALYEMLTGERPFRADSTAALIHAIRHDDPPPLEQRRPDVPIGVARIVDACLEKDAAARYGDAELLAADLAAVQHAVDGRRRDLESPPPLSATAAGAGRTRIAVLPLRDDGSDDGDAYLADAMTWELTTRLSTLDRLCVTAVSAAARYRDDETDAREAGRALNARVLLTGSASKRGLAVGLSLRLLHPYRTEPLWAERLTGDLHELPALVGEIVGRVAGALQVPIRPTERRRLARHGTDRTDALAHYLSARSALLDGDAEGIGRAVASFQQALAADPSFADAWSGLALAFQTLAGLSVSDADLAYPQAVAAAERALALDEELAEAHTALATAYAYHQLNAGAAERHFRRAVELDPSHAAARGFLAEQLRNQGRFDEALLQIHAAQELNPGSPSHAFEEGLILYVARRNEEALARLQRLQRSHPGFHVVYFGIALVLVQQRRYEEALAALQVLDPLRQSPDARALRGYACALMGRRAEAEEMLASLGRSLSDPRPELDPSPFHAAVVHVGLGELDRALTRLTELRQRRSWHAGLLKVEPMLDPLRADPRFQRLLAEVGLDQAPPLLTPISRPR